jgi:hypothetical protein
MKILDAFTQSYSDTARYVEKMLPIMPRFVPTRYKVYKKYCASDKLAAEGIAWNTGPELIIDNIMALRGHTAAGLFSPTLGVNTIYFDIECADKYEADPQKFAVAIQYTLLHELIHWARHHGTVTSDVDGKEAGNTFEKEAYGQDVSYLWRHR